MHTKKWPGSAPGVVVAALCAVFLGGGLVRSAFGADCAFRAVQELAPGALGAGDSMGNSIAIDGDVAVIGVSNDNEGGSTTGSVYVYQFDGVTWVEQQRLRAPVPTPGAYFGSSVSVLGDMILVGATQANQAGMAGAAYLFRFDGATWQFEAELTPSAGLPGDRFGNAVVLDEDRAFIGSFLSDQGGTSSGSVYVFGFDGAQWSEEALLTAPDAAAHTFFGLSIAQAGESLLIGAPRDHQAGLDAGAVYDFRVVEGTWSYVAKLLMPGGVGDEGFGWSISADGNVALIGAPEDDTVKRNAGRAVIYRNDGDGWLPVGDLFPPQRSNFNFDFGYSVALHGDVIVVGAIGDMHGGPLTRAGSAYAYFFDGIEWAGRGRLIAVDPTSFDWFGYSVAIRDDGALVGAINGDVGGSNSGAVTFFRGISDCNGTGVLDGCEVASCPVADSDGNGVHDACDKLGQPLAEGSIIVVPDDYPTIQGAIDSAVDGDEIVVLPGTYHEHIDFLGKRITVRSSDPADADTVAGTVIDGGYLDTAVRFVTIEPPDALLDGLTIRHGRADIVGGGIYVNCSSPTIQRCVIEECVAASGGGVGTKIGSAVVRDCEIRNNVATVGGGGIYSAAGTAVYEHCRIHANYSVLSGGGVMSDRSNMTLHGCLVQNNEAVFGSGGGMFLVGGDQRPVDMVVRSCAFLDNAAGDNGGASFSSNTSHQEPFTTLFENCTFVNNTATLAGGAFYAGNDTQLINSIVWRNEEPLERTIRVRGHELFVEYSDLWRGQDAILTQYSARLVWGEGNIDLRPRFRPDGFHLHNTSPCRNTGDPDWVPPDGDTDIDGEDRVQEGRVDMGADEISSNEAARYSPRRR